MWSLGKGDIDEGSGEDEEGTYWWHASAVIGCASAAVVVSTSTASVKNKITYSKCYSQHIPIP